MRTVEEFEPFLLAYVPTMPQELLQHAIRETIVEFMRDTKCASATLDVITQENVNDYIIEVPDCRRIVKVKKVSQGTTRCNGAEYWSELHDGEFGDYKVELRLGSNPIIVLNNTPRKPGKLRVEYVWTIGRDDCDIPDFIYDDYMQAIVAGTLVRVASYPNNEHLLNQLKVLQVDWFDSVQRAKIDKTGGKARRIVGAPILSRRGRALWR